MKQLVRFGVVLIMVLGLAGPAASATVYECVYRECKCNAW